jgi:zinc transporter
MQVDNGGLVAAYLLDGHGGGRRCEWQDIRQWQPEQGTLWVHLNRDADTAQTWLRGESGLDPVVVEALLDETTRPRCVPMDAGVMLFLRGVNLNPGADPEDMVSIRLWIEGRRVISTRMRRLLSVNDLREALDAGRGPVDVGDFVAQLSERLVSRMAGIIADVDDQVDQLQEQVLETERRQLRIELTRLRREMIVLRRYLAPQRDALARLTQLKLDWLSTDDMLRVREEADRVTRFVEDLDAARERAAVTQEELANRLSEQLNSRMYVLSIVAAVFLPLGFLTGLLGINVGGIPLAESPWGFLAVVGGLIGVTALELLVFRWRRWF